MRHITPDATEDARGRSSTWGQPWAGARQFQSLPNSSPLQATDAYCPSLQNTYCPAGPLTVIFEVTFHCFRPALPSPVFLGKQLLMVSN